MFVAGRWPVNIYPRRVLHGCADVCRADAFYGDGFRLRALIGQ